MIKFLKNNALYLLIIVTILIVVLILCFQTKNKIPKYDTSMFNVVDVKRAINLFNNDKVTYLYIGRQGCSASYEFTNSVEIAMARFNIKVNYLDLDLLTNNEESKKFISLLDIDYTLNGNTKKYGEFIGTTPMFIIIKNKKMIYGEIGKMTSDDIKKIIDRYGA